MIDRKNAPKCTKCGTATIEIKLKVKDRDITVIVCPTCRLAKVCEKTPKIFQLLKTRFSRKI